MIRQFLQIVYIVGTKVPFPFTTVSGMKNSLFFLLITTASTEIICKASKINVPRMRTYNAKPYHDPDNHTERTSLDFKLLYHSLFIQTARCLRHSASVRNCLFVVDAIGNCIVNYKLTGLKGFPKSKFHIKQ